MSFVEEVAKAESLSKSQSKGDATLKVEEWFLHLSQASPEEKSVVVVDRDGLHFASIHWKPSDPKNKYSQAVKTWAKEVAAIPATVVKAVGTSPTASRNSSGGYQVSHFRLRGLDGCHVPGAPNWDGRFYQHRSQVGHLVFGESAEVVRQQIVSYLAIHFNKVFLKMDNWQKDGYLRQHPFPDDWTEDEDTKKRIAEAGASLWQPYTGYALKWPVQSADCSPHVDSADDRCSLCTVMAFGDFEGGDLVMHQPGIVTALGSGDMITFPPSTIWHSNKPITKGKRGSTISFLTGSLLKLKKGKLHTTTPSSM
ncbi:hypothetical protein CBS101457_000001 [Exobasidium rhododendri]|nr:hypothetical protein CBS101457_000001 [Exobasidium rhododendri]